MQWETLLLKFNEAPKEVVNATLVDFYKECTGSALSDYPVDLLSAERDGEDKFRIRYAVSGPNAWGILQAHPGMLDEIRDKIKSVFGDKAAFEFIKPSEGSCLLDIGLLALALKFAPLVSAGCAVTMLGITLSNLFKSKKP